MSELKKCPFCGGEAGLEEVPGSPFTDEPYAWGVGCNECNIGWYKETETEAAAAWNRRAQPENEPLVHCAECEHYTPSPMGGKGCLIHFNGHTEIIPRNPTDYCSYGRRKPERSEG